MYAYYIVNGGFEWTKFTQNEVDNFRQKIIFDIEKMEL
jgi:hypothetical protein